LYLRCLDEQPASNFSTKAFVILNQKNAGLLALPPCCGMFASHPTIRAGLARCFQKGRFGSLADIGGKISESTLPPKADTLTGGINVR
jgi:hypothetical protein